MNKLFKGVLGTSLCLAAALGVGIGIVANNHGPVAASAVSYEYKMTPNAATSGSSSTSYVTADTAFTAGDVAWTFRQWNPSSLQVKTNQTSAAGQFCFFSGEFSGVITQVVITFKSIGGMTDSSLLKMKGSTTAFTSQQNSGGESMVYSSANKTLTWTAQESAGYKAIAFYQDGKAMSGSNYLATSDSIVVTYIPSSVEKGFAITGVTSSGVYLKSESYEIGYEAVGFEEEPTITDVVWTVPSGAGSIADGHWTTGEAINDSVTLSLDLKANGDAYHTEVVTKIDQITAFKKDTPKSKFTTNDVFTVGSNFKLEYEYASEGSLPETDEGISYRLEDTDGNKLKDIVYNSTKFTLEESENYVDATYKGVDLAARYSITVVSTFNNSNGAYYLVTDESELKDGDHVTLFGHYKKDTLEKTFVPTSFESNNVRASFVELDHDAVDAKQEYTILDFVLADTSKDLAGSFAFSSSNDPDKLGKYLYAAGSDKNYMKTQDEINQNARFVIDINDSTHVASAVATGASYTRNKMGANINNSNPANSPLFSCYTNLQEGNSLYLYKWVSNQDKLDEFVAAKMAMDKTVENQCLTLYPLAKEAFNNLTASQKQLFVDESGEGQRYHDAYARLAAWAAAHGDIISTSGAGSYNLKAGLPAGGLNGTTVGIITAISVITVVGVGAVIVLHKKKRIR